MTIDRPTLLLALTKRYVVGYFPSNLGIRRHMTTGGEINPKRLVASLLGAFGIAGNVVSPILRPIFQSIERRQATRKGSYWRSG